MYAIKLMMRDPATASARIYVGSLSDDVTQEDVEMRFSAHGKVLGVLMNKGFCFVQFEDERSAKDAIDVENRSTFQGRNIVVRCALRSASTSSAPDSSLRGDRVISASSSGAGKVRWEQKDTSYADRDRSPLHNYNQNNRYYNSSFLKSTYDSSTVREKSQVNICEIIVVSKNLANYAEFIEGMLLRMGIKVDLLFPNENIPIGRVVDQICSRGCLYAILVLPQNEKQRLMTLNILHGAKQEYRNIPLTQAISILREDFKAYCRGDNVSSGNRHPVDIQTLIDLLADNKTLTVLQYDKLIRYLEQRRQLQVTIELGDVSDISVESSHFQMQQVLQQRILGILNKPEPKAPSTIPEITAEPMWPAPAPVSKPEASPGLLQDPKVQRALDDIMKGSLLQNYSENKRSS